MGVLVKEEVDGLEGLLNRFFLMPIKLPISQGELIFFANSGGNGWFGGRAGVEGFDGIEDLEG